MRVVKLKNKRIEKREKRKEDVWINEKYKNPYMWDENAIE
jgi:hypothetical protein